MDVRRRVALGDAVLPGVVAWLALNAFVYFVAPLFGLSVGLVGRFFGSLLFPSAGTVTQVWIGRALLLGAALGWSVLYRRTGMNVTGPGWLRGLVFGTGIWVASALVLPLIGALHRVYGSVSGVPFPGLFGVGFDGGAGVVLAVLAHAVFGMTLGAVTNAQARGE